MSRFEFETIRFIDRTDFIRFVFMKIFYFDVSKIELEKIGSFKLESHAIEFDCSQKRADHKFRRVLEAGLDHLTNMITKNPATYVHSASGIPLIGNNSFGIVDRNTNIIEIKPITGCNLDCIFCSVPDCNRERDFIVEEEYIVSETKKLISYKAYNDIEAHIGVQGEPLLYADLVKLVSDLKEIPEIKRISMNTNATLLTEEMVDKLIEAGMTKINISLNSLSHIPATDIAGSAYNLDHVKSIVKYLAEKYPDNVHIAPVVMFGINDETMDDLVKYAKSLGIKCWIQNFLEYGGGKRPVKQKDWDYFRTFLQRLEKSHGMKLLLDFKGDFFIKETKALPKHFSKDDVIDAEIVCHGRLKDEFIAKHKDRTISVINNKRRKLVKGSRVKLKITYLKHNISKGVIVN